MSADHPAFSVITLSKNHAAALENTIKTVQAQSFTDWEHIVIDAASTDGTVDILRKYPHVRYVSEPDDGCADAINKGLRMARGKYVTILLIWDLYCDPDWLAACNEAFSNHPEISLIHARCEGEDTEGKWSPPFPREPFTQTPAQSTAFFYYYLLAPFFRVNDIACMARREVWLACHPLTKFEVDVIDSVLEFNVNFHKDGYLAWFLPRIATNTWSHKTSRAAAEAQSGIARRNLDIFRTQRRDLRTRLLTFRAAHTFRLPDGSPHPTARFSRLRLIAAFVIYKILRVIRKNILRIDASYRNPGEIHWQIRTALQMVGLWAGN